DELERDLADARAERDRLQGELEVLATAATPESPAPASDAITNWFRPLFWQGVEEVIAGGLKTPPSPEKMEKLRKWFSNVNYRWIEIEARNAGGTKAKAFFKEERA